MAIVGMKYNIIIFGLDEAIHFAGAYTIIRNSRFLHASSFYEISCIKSLDKIWPRFLIISTQFLML